MMTSASVPAPPEWEATLPAFESAPTVGGFDTDVVIVGTGPTGSTAALALATAGIRTTVVSQHSWLSNTPRAHITNQRAMEVLRDLGVEAEVMKYASGWEVMAGTFFGTSLAGTEIARLNSYGQGDDLFGEYRAASPCSLVDIPQTFLEPLLVKNAAARGARIAFSTEYLGHDQDADGVTVRLRNRVSGHEYSLRCRYLIGADGARSKVAEELGIEFVGHTARGGTVYARFEADLTRYAAHRPGILYWMMSPTASFGEIGMGMLRCVRPWHEWIAGWGFDVAGGEPDTSPEHVLSQIRALVGDPDLEPTMLGTSLWYVNQQYATTMSKGRVFCGGDATHRHPPSNGLGSNTCIQDAFNLAWKLAYVIRGDAGPALLDSYQAERVPVGKQVVERANLSRVEYGPLRREFDTAGEGDPIDNGLARLFDESAEGAERRSRLHDALRLKRYDYDAHGVELNQRYRSGAVIADPEPEVFARDPQLHAQITSRPGAKLPHTWVVDALGTKVSTLDIVGHGRMTLLTGLSGRDWQRAAAGLDLPYLDVVVIGDPAYRDLYFTWAERREIDEAGAILVRPDGYVAWRHPVAPASVDDAARLLGQALSHVLAKDLLAGSPAS
jgi:2,4-dichlorophenol 6-monooxygenase